MAKKEKIKGETGLYTYPMENGDITYIYTYKDTSGKTHEIKVGRASDGFRIADVRNQRRDAISKDKNNPEALYIQKRRKKNIITFQDLADRYYKDKKPTMKSYQDSNLDCLQV